MDPLTIRILLTIFIQVAKLLRRYYADMSPEQQKEWRQAIKDMPMPDDLDPEHGMGGQ